MSGPPIPASLSYTQRRAAEKSTLGRGPMPLAHSFRASWGPGGLIAFGSRSLHLVKLKDVDGATTGSATAGATAAMTVTNAATEAEAQVARIERSLRVRVDGFAKNELTPTLSATKQLPLAPSLEAALAQFKAAAGDSASGGADRRAIDEQHMWKLVAVTLSRALADQPVATGAALQPSTAEKELQWERQREALRGWLRDTQAEVAAQQLKDGSAAEASEALWSLASALQDEAALHRAIEGDVPPYAYMAAVLCQPTKAVREDMRQQLRAWEQLEASIVPGNPVPLLPPATKTLVSYMSGEEQPREALKGRWRGTYALQLQYGGDDNAAAAPPWPLAEEGGESPRDPAWHLLRLRYGPEQELRPLPPRQPDHTSATASWVELRDYSLSWHLRLVVGELNGMRPPTNEERLHRSFLEQLELLGCWRGLAFAASSCPSTPRAEASMLYSMLSRLPPPDKPPATIEALLDFATLSETAPLTAEGKELSRTWTDESPHEPFRLLALLHAAAAQLAHYERRPAAQLRHYLDAQAAAQAAGPGCELPSFAAQEEAALEALLCELLPAQLVRGLRGDFEDLLYVLERLDKQAPRHRLPGWTESSKSLLSGRNCLRYLKCLQDQHALMRDLSSGDASALEQLGQVRDEAEDLLKSLTMQKSAAERLKWEEKMFGSWLPATAMQVLARAEMEAQLQGVCRNVQYVEEQLDRPQRPGQEMD